MRPFGCAPAFARLRRGKQDKLQQAAAATAPQTAVTSAFDDLSGQRYDNIWRINVLRVVVSFLFRIPILWINARGIWYLVAVR